MAYEVEIFGQSYSLRSDAEEEHVRRVAGLVDLKMREVAAGTRSVSTLHIAVLAALDIASEYMHTEARAESLVAEIEARAEAMVRRIVSASS